MSDSTATEYYCSRCRTVRKVTLHRTTCGQRFLSCPCGGCNLEVSSVDTFNGWSNRGWRIRKGTHSIGRNEAGVPLFAFFQTYAPSPSRGYAERRDESDTTYGADAYWQDECDSR